MLSHSLWRPCVCCCTAAALACVDCSVEAVAVLPPPPALPTAAAGTHCGKWVSRALVCVCLGFSLATTPAPTMSATRTAGRAASTLHSCSSVSNCVGSAAERWLPAVAAATAASDFGGELARRNSNVTSVCEEQRKKRKGKKERGQRLSRLDKAATDETKEQDCCALFFFSFFILFTLLHCISFIAIQWQTYADRQTDIEDDENCPLHKRFYDLLTVSFKRKGAPDCAARHYSQSLSSDFNDSTATTAAKL